MTAAEDTHHANDSNDDWAEEGRVSDTHHVLPPDLDHTPVPDEQVERAREVIRRSALVPFWTSRLTPTPRVLPDGTRQGKGGQPRTGVTVEGLLVAMLLVAIDRKAMHLGEFSAMLHHRISPAMRTELGILRPAPGLLADRASASTPRKTVSRAETLNATRQITRLFHAMLAPVDPSPFPKNKAITKAELNKIVRPMTADERRDRQDLLDYVTGRILEATWLMLPRPVRRAWKGSVGQDATFVATWSRGRRTKGPDSATDPDAGWYVRSGDHNDLTGIGGKHHPDGTPKAKFGYDAEIVVIGSDDPDDQRRFPFLSLGVRLHKPGHAPG
ncbi:MAG: hypothetical protein H7233_06710, partial [Pseudorhodobacter sp.]|nr:hypothetical protein [Frankiaceae bacterium]